jgi:hypothetical protein
MASDNPGQRDPAADIPRGQVGYVTVGGAFRQAVERANEVRPRLNGRERAILDAVFVLTVSRSKLLDVSYNAAIAALASVEDMGTVRKALKKLSELGIIVYVHGNHYRKAVYALPPPAGDDSREGGESVPRTEEESVLPLEELSE